MKKKIYFFAAVLFVGLISTMFYSCTKEGPAGPAGKNGAAVSAEDQAAFDGADGSIGARLYDHPLNEAMDQDANVSFDASMIDYPNFFRCKSCHGWDLRGQKGVLIGKAPSATYPTAVDVDLYAWAKRHNIREVFEAVKNIGGRNSKSYNSLMPDYSPILTDAQIWDIVKFLKNVAHNVMDFYDMKTTGVYPTGTVAFSDIGKGGNAANGLAVYNTNCAGCHGADGTSINIYCQGEYLGDMFRDDPHEIQHKAIWGMPTDREHIAGGCNVPFSGEMPVQNITSQDIRDMMVMGQDESKFPGF